MDKLFKYYALDGRGIQGANKRPIDHAYDSYAYEGFLPNSLYLGWANISENRKVKGKDQFIYAAQFALLAQYCIENN